ncbi:hypothetical protein V6N11_038417 [Hibiscus sabdariffa]|uniref:Uncharacterized protein n=1 Tax=Hibiscus sabdariffa TaxID=183260 RepID=A0ABR2SKR4_9ROSI
MKIEKKTDDMCNLVKDSNLKRIDYRADFPSLEFFPSDEIVTPTSSTVAFIKIMEALKDDKIKIFRMWGMRGIACSWSWWITVDEIDHMSFLKSGHLLTLE